MSARVLTMIAFCAALLCGVTAYAAGELTAAQQSALNAEIVKRAPVAPAAQRQAFSVGGLTGDFIFGARQIGRDAAGESASCRGVIVELSAPQHSALETRVCLSGGGGGGGKEDGPGASNSTPASWSLAAPLTPAHSAAAEARPAKPIPAPPPPASTPTPAPPPPAPEATRGWSGGALGGSLGSTGANRASDGAARVITAVLVELAPTEPRYARNGGAGIVLLSENAADRALNLSLCRALFKNFDTATNAEVKAGERKETEDKVQLLRPLYWPLKDLSKPALGADKCTHRIDHYDFARAWKVRSKLGLNGRGPYLLVARADETRAGLVDFAGVSATDTPDLVRYFRDGFSQQGDIWSPARHQAGPARIALDKFLGRAIQLASLPRLVTVTALRAGCPLGDPMDVCTNPLPRVQ